MSHLPYSQCMRFPHWLPQAQLRPPVAQVLTTVALIIIHVAAIINVFVAQSGVTWIADIVEPRAE